MSPNLSPVLAATRFLYVDGRAIYRVTGVVTPGEWPLLVGAYATRVAMQRPVSSLFDMSGAALLVTASQMVEGVRRQLEIEALRRWPQGIVANPVNEATLREYAWQMAQHGVVRGVFTDVLNAAVWLEAQELALAGERVSEPARRSAPATRTRRVAP